jgi:hypothetical protein
MFTTAFITIRPSGMDAQMMGLYLLQNGKDQGKKKENKYDPTKEFCMLDSSLPKRRGQTPEDRARDIEGALDWLRSKAPGAADDDDSIPLFDKIGSVSMSRRSPEQRAKDLDDALNWMRNKGKDDDAFIALCAKVGSN